MPQTLSSAWLILGPFMTTQCFSWAGSAGATSTPGHTKYFLPNQATRINEEKHNLQKSLIYLLPPLYPQGGALSHVILAFLLQWLIKNWDSARILTTIKHTLKFVWRLNPQHWPQPLPCTLASGWALFWGQYSVVVKSMGFEVNLLRFWFWL